MLQKIRSGAVFLNLIIMFDEAHFYLTGSVNKQKFGNNSWETLTFERDNGLDRIAEIRIIGSYFFEGTLNTGHHDVDKIKTLTTHQLLHLTCWKYISKIESSLEEPIFSGHHTFSTFKCMISFCGVIWNRAPILIRDLKHLTANVHSEISNIPHSIVEKCSQNFVKRHEVCEKFDGAHLSCITFEIKLNE